MFKDNLLFKEIHETVAHDVVQAFRPGLQTHNGIVIAVFGISGTGKSEVAWWIARKLYGKNISSHVIALDRFYKIPVHDREHHRRQTNIIGHEEMDFDRINKEIDKFYSLDKINVLILEGLYAGYVSRSNMRVYLAATIDSTYEFRKLRGKENPDSKWRQYVLQRECESVVKSRKAEDEVYDV